MYPCTALLLLCLFSTIITYILNHRWELLQEGSVWWEGRGLTKYWQVFLSQMGCCDGPRLLPSLYLEGSGVGKHIWGVKAIPP